MRTRAKPNAPYGMGISAASCYDSGIKSAATDLEALLDRYRFADLLVVMHQINEDLTLHGGSDNNGALNTWLNAQPRPTPRKTKRRRAKK